uniref:Transcriptional regulator n=1 Tax=uncultured marine thaumarchaeote KM3_70_D05 TaxID=1456251 RepID=A0A075HG01_9ARCH|nr:transcriptional regulator [uncultured marine thaumarchaeote KM3_70_D05]
MVKNDSKLGEKKQKKINKIKEQLARLREKLNASETNQPSFSSKPEFKKIKAKTKQTKNKKIQVKEAKKKETIIKVEVKKKSKEAKKKEAGIKAVAKKKAKEAKKKETIIKVEVKKKSKEAKKKEARIKAVAKKKEARIKAVAKKKEARIKAVAKKKEARIKAEAKKKAKEAKKKEAKIKAEAKKKAKEEAQMREEEAKKKEEEAKRTYEEELEEQLSEEEITGFQLEKTDMDKMCNRVCEIIAGYETNGTLQSELWKKLKLSSRDGSRLALKLERMGMITREKILEKERWTYRLIIKKIPVSTKSIEGAPCLTCPVQSKCSIDGEISPKTCQWIEDWVLIELKNK